jgi:putative aldouronate transport system permease protein
MPNIKKKFDLTEILLTLILGALALVCLYPFFSVYIYAFNDGIDSMKAPLFFWPRKFTFNNIKVAFMEDFVLNAIFISVARTVLGTFLHVLFTSALGYAMMMRKIPGYKFFSYFFFITFLFSGGFIPSYLLLKELHLLNTFWVLILPGMISYWYMIIFRSFFDSIPKSLIESVEIDGGSYFTIFFRIFLPLSRPVYAAVSLFIAVNFWNEWFAGLFYIQKDSLRPLQAVLINLMQRADMMSKMMEQGSGSLNASMNAGITPYSIRVAIVVISVTPIIMIYPFLQKHFAKGLMIGSVKG